MGSDSPVNVAIMFIERINRRDWAGLVGLMSPDHRLITGDVTAGREKAHSVLSGYCTSNPEFQIHISDIYAQGNSVIIVGRTTGSCAQQPREVEIRKTQIYATRVENGLITEFHHYGEGTEQVKRELGLSSNTRVTE